MIVLIGVIALSFGGNGCRQGDSGSSVPPPVTNFLAYLYELVTDTGWWKTLSANYQNEGRLQHIGIKTASSTNYQND
jgi:hypothetical protein